MKKKPTARAARDQIINTDLSRESFSERTDPGVDAGRYTHIWDVKLPFLRFGNRTDAPAASPIGVGSAILHLVLAGVIGVGAAAFVAWLTGAATWVWAVSCPLIFLVVVVPGLVLMFRNDVSARRAAQQHPMSDPD